MGTIVIIDYGSGNLRSVAKAFEHEAGKDHTIRVSAEPKAIATATHIVLPGVGAFADCMQGLNSVAGMREALEKQVRVNKKPFLGICVGMQLLFEESHEHGVYKGLGWIGGKVVKINSGLSANPVIGDALPQSPDSPTPLKIPHMGWNELDLLDSHPLLAGIAPKSHAYFVHSYHAKCSNAWDVIATTHYGEDLTAVVASGNIMGTQFHPEKSQETGLKLIGNFLRM